MFSWVDPWKWGKVSDQLKIILRAFNESAQKYESKTVYWWKSSNRRSRIFVEAILKLCAQLEQERRAWEK